MRLFGWLCARDIPPTCDLRRCGWALANEMAQPAVMLAHVLDNNLWTQLPRRRQKHVLLLGVTSSAERARLLAQGYGDVLGEDDRLEEIAERAARIDARAAMLPADYIIGELRLNLFARDGFVDDRPLALHPREFALLWRLAETPGMAVGKRALVTDVWRQHHLPETNSLAVHIFRLRAKLAAAGLDGLVLTAPDGGYMLAPQENAPKRAIPLITEDSCLNDLIAE